MTIIRQGLISLGLTVVPVSNVTLDPGILETGRRSAGDNYATQQTVFGARPAVTCTMPLGTALDTVGLTCLRMTAFTLSLIKIDSSTGLDTAGAGNVQFTLATSALAYAVVSDFQARQGALATATVQIWLISADGTTHPLSKGAGARLSLSAQPTLHTLGPVDLNGSELPAVAGVSGSLQHEAAARTTDGDLYPTEYAWRASMPMLSIDHSDPDALLTALGLTGSNISAATKVAFLARGSDNLISSTEKSITIGDGHISPRQESGGVGQTASQGFDILAASSDGTTHPWTLGA